MDGEMDLTGCLKVICVSGFYQFCFLKLDAATLESKEYFFAQAQCAVSTHLNNNCTAFPALDILWLYAMFSKELVHISLYFVEEAKRLLKWHSLVNLEHRWGLTLNLAR